MSTNTVHVTIAGNLTRDPELRFTPSGDPVVNLSVAVTPRVKKGDEWADGETAFYNVAAWRKEAENVAESLHKGDRVIVTGTLRVRAYETDGMKRTSMEVDADEVGASLAWATAAITRNLKAANGQGGASAPAAAPAAGAPAAAAAAPVAGPPDF